MKTQKGSRLNDNDELRKPRRLEPIHKSGKERHNSTHNRYEDDDDDELIESYKKRESAYDYFDDGEDENIESEEDAEEYEEEEYDEDFEEEEYEEEK